MNVGTVVRLAAALCAAAMTLVLLVAPTASGARATPSHGDFAGRVALPGGRHLYLECRGSGRPIVLLEAGLRSRSDFWSVRMDDTPTPTVLPGVAATTRVCAYDRPGTTLGSDAFSRSDPVTMPRTAADAVADLHALIAAAGLRGPFVLAGHSTGGLIVRLYASKYPRQVAGLVMVDALSEFLQGPLTPKQVAAYDELNNAPLPGVDYPDLEQILFRPSFAQMRAATRRHPPRRIPTIVISRALALDLPSGLPAGLTTPVVERAWADAQRALARHLPGARREIARRSSHYIMFSQPGLIIAAIDDVVERVRDKLHS